MKHAAPSLEIIESHIFTLRGHRVMLDTHLAELYEVETKNINKAVKRNLRRFPDDSMFQINEIEFGNLRFQIGTSSKGHGGRRYLPYVFTEQGVSKLSSVLNSDRATDVNVAIMSTFCEDARSDDRAQESLPPPVPPKRPIGFVARDKE